jgi:universal stress protein A
MEPKPRKILWPTDFSSLSLTGGRYALAFCRSFQAQLHVIHVIPPMLGPELPATIPPEMPPLVADPALLQTSKQNLEKVVRDLAGSTDNVVIEAFYGSPWDGVCDYAKRNEIDLIIVATHGRTGLAHALIGSTAERIVQHAPCPVLSVKQNARDFLQ